MDRNIRKFELTKQELKVKELLNGDFVEIDIDAISTDYPNNNNSHFTKESLEDAKSSVINKPIMGCFNKAIGPMGDFEAHNDNGLHYDPQLQEMYYSYESEDSEVALGCIRESDNVRVEFDEVANKYWLKISAVLWSKYNYEKIKSLLMSRKGQSRVSVEVEVLDSFVDEKGIEVIKKFNLLCVTILGAKVKEGIEAAGLRVLNYLESEKFARNQKCLAFAYSALDDYNKKQVETPVDQGSNTNSFESEVDINESPKEEITMDEKEQDNQEGGGVNSMNLSYEAKRELIEKYLRDNLETKEYWVWVCDMTDTECYFEFDGATYRAPYVINQSEENSEVIVSLDQKEQVIRSWTVFEAENSDAADTPVAEENEKDFADNSEEKDEEPKKEDEACDCGEKEQEACGDQEGQKEEEACDCDQKEEEACGCEGKEDEACGEQKEEEACGSEDKEDEACKSCEAEAEEDQKEAEACGDGEKEEEACGKETKFAAAPTVEINGESCDINALYAKYNELEGKYNELIHENQVKLANSLTQFGATFINSDTVVDEESKKQYIQQVKEKCEAFEFTTEDEVTKFAKSLMAMYYYENKVQKENKTEDFSISLENPIRTEAPKNKLKEAINKLNHAQ